ncbi:helix-turn-helix transcriptional regulator [Enterocloster bolteae]|uniref:helix-turn-helix transcriptional regulator n=1 Tax=Enterocloster bolteae TaxID=208479 RepID=UPI001FF38613|nr:HTH domain-containing protein [Enterocloster bolteae]UOX70882.1 HTH domain-containing protein [Enterocloster bolteae]
MKIDRLIGIITILLQKEKVTISQLAKRFEVSCRTIQRDIDDICKAGIPIVSMQGYGGGFPLKKVIKLIKQY